MLELVKELTQSIIAVTLVGSVAYGFLFMPDAHSEVMNTAIGMVLSFYFLKSMSLNRPNPPSNSKPSGPTDPPT